MNELSINDVDDKIEDDLLSKKESLDVRARIMTAATLILLPLLYFLPAVIGQIALVPGDGLSQNLGVRILTGQMLRDGHLPLWNPYIFAGTPLLASIYPGVLYPPNWIFALFAPVTAMNIVVITTYHLTLIGTYLYARSVRMTRVGALIAGVSFTFGGYMIAHMGHTSRIAAAAWMPWVLLAIENLYCRLTRRWIILGAVFIALQLFAGEPQMNLYTIMLCGAYFLFSFYMREEREKRLRFLFGVATMSVCGALVSAIQLLPERELLRMGERSAISYDYFSAYSFPPQNILTFIFPFFFGGASVPYATVPYWGKWSLDEMCGYFGLLTLMLALVAVFTARKRSVVAFWGVFALVALTLSFGDFLPFNLNRILHILPVYSLFRASARHMYEFTFCLAMLGGFGASYLARTRREDGALAPRRAAILFVALVGLTIIFYRFFSKYLPVGYPRIDSANALTNFEVWFPMIVATVSFATFGIYWLLRSRNSYVGALLVAVVFADMMVFGVVFNWGWRDHLIGASARLKDTPAVQFIKSREADLNSFRVASYYTLFGYKYDQLNTPNLSIARGLQSVNGYDLLRLNRMGAVAGNMGGDGIISETAAFGSEHQGLNLLNVKYLLCLLNKEGHRLTTDIEGIHFDKEYLNLNMTPGSKAEASLDGSMASELAIVSLLANSVHIPDESPVARIRLRTKDGRVIEQELRAGRDTAEWAYEKDEVRAAIKHRRPKVVEAIPAEGFTANRYLARLPFERSEIVGVDIEYLRTDASLLILRASLFDSTTGAVTTLGAMQFYESHWRRLGTFGDVEVRENVKALPRAWFASRAATGSSAEVLETIRTGKLKDGTAFDPAETVLFELSDFGNREHPQVERPVNAEVKVTKYEPQRIELETRNERSGFLTLSEIYYRGWEAWVDGVRAPVERVNYALRGVTVPAGEHRVEFIFRAHSFRNGAAWSLLGVLLLLLVSSGKANGTLTRIEPKLEGPAVRRALAQAKAKLPGIHRTKSLLHSIHRILTRARAKLSDSALSRLIMIVVVVGALIYGYFLVSRASYAVGGADSSGYAQIARSFLKGGIVQPVTELDLLGLPNDFDLIFMPLGAGPGKQRGTMTSFYPIGFPLLMAAGALINGSERGQCLVPPIIGALSLILIYFLGLELGLPRIFSLVGAIMLAGSPTFISYSTQPMSDVAGMFWAMAAILAALRSRKHDVWALLAGAAFGMAFLTRPSSVLLLIPILFSIRLNFKNISFFILGGLPLALIFFMYNFIAFGSPLETGYGRINIQSNLRLSGFTERFGQYWYWIKVTMSPLPLLGWLVVVADRKVDWRNRVMLVSWFGAFLLFYSFYDISGAWWWTRFLLPAYPAMILGAMLVARDVLGLFRKWISEVNRTRLKWAVLAILLCVTLSHEKRNIRRFDLFNLGPAEIAHSASCRWADNTIPSNSLLVSKQMSGALKFYTKRHIVRWDWLDPVNWTTLRRQAAEKGYQWYALLMPFEIDDAKKRMGGKWTKLGMVGQISLWRIELTSA